MSGHASKQCVSRLQKEYRAFLKEPPPGIKAHPNPQNILEWHYVLEGHKGSDFDGGIYHGKVLFHPQYPFKAPGIMMLTPNGRFKTGSRLCLSMSDFHPETWNPLWSIGTILTGLMSFMYDNEITTGALRTPSTERQMLAKQSLEVNLKNPQFREMFPEYIAEHDKRTQETKQRAAAQTEHKKEDSKAQASVSVLRGNSPSSILLISTFALAMGSILLVPMLT